ncbi:MAG: type II toxin-antitoxin system Phd/YefM family antitoxin [Gammaproteobacteria bacterium]
MTTTLTSREFNQDTGRAKKAARKGPVIITDRGQPVNVLLSYGEYQRLAGRHKNLAERLAVPVSQYVEFEPPRLFDEFPKPPDLG